MKYALVDTLNTFSRARHVAARGSDSWARIGMAIHITLSSVQKAVRDFGVDHVVFCLEGRSWRRDYYAPYKRNRQEARAAQTTAQAEEDREFFAAYDDLCKFLIENSACTVLQCKTAEADDLIARWIALHNNDQHVVISSDSDFHQLICESVTQFNGVTNEHITPHGVFDHRGRAVLDKRTKEPKQLKDPKWILFEKCMRGDPTDNIFSAYPGVRVKGTKNRVGLLEAYADLNNQGFNWNNLMLQRWVDHQGVEHRVLDDYKRNCQLIDLTAQPQAIKDTIDSSIVENLVNKKPTQIGSHFLKFCGKYELNRIADSAQSYVAWLGKKYPGSLDHVGKTHS